MSELYLEFVNEINNENYKGSIDSNDTVKRVVELLRNEKEFRGLKGDISLKTRGGDILECNKTFYELNIADGSKLFLASSGSSPNSPETEIIEPLAPEGEVLSPQQFHQLGIFVLDGSGSMKELTNGNIKKKDAVNMAIRDLLTRFKVSDERNNFSFGVVTFDFSATVHTTACPLDNIDENGDYDPMKKHGSGTHIHSGLDEAKKITTDFLSNPTSGVQHSVIILLLSDGECHQPDKTREAANAIKNMNNVTICTTFLSRTGKNNTEAESLMKEIASDPIMGFKKVYDSETLRNFFVSSISRASGVKID